MADGMAAAQAAALYKRDFYAWARQQADALRRADRGARPEEIDFMNLSEEVEDLARRERQQLAERIETIAEHLAELQFSPAQDPRAGWRATVRRTRSAIARLLDDSPSLRRELNDLVERSAPPAVLAAVEELKERGEVDAGVMAALGAASYTVDEIVSPDWWPDAMPR